MADASNEPRMVTPLQAKHALNAGLLSPYERNLAHTVATEPDRIRAAVVKALRRFNDEYDGDALMLADAIENGADL